jgi:hypothetical protein
MRINELTERGVQCKVNFTRFFVQEEFATELFYEPIS